MAETELQKFLVNHYKANILHYMDEHPGAFEEAIRLALGPESPYAWRASWILWSCMETNDARIRPLVGDLIRNLTQVKENRQREWLIILQKMEIDEQYEGVLYDACVGIWEQVNKKPGVRLHAFRMMAKLADKYPELAKEMAFLSQEHYLESLSGGVRSIVTRMANRFDKA
ncbi:MAG: hypothetical protein V2I46_13065 [Bacteroides sp.]|jgi:hypothetical protein|nr:hypothetical protein [Bacteroides sp.]